MTTGPTTEEITCKAILPGDSGIGKTCIIKRLCENAYNALSTSTIGASAKTKIICYSNTQRIKLQVWDTAGQECYRSLNKIFYRDAKIVILVYDITIRKSFEELKHYWYRQVETTCEKDPIIGIAGNKCDRYVEEQVSESEVKEFAEKIGAIFKYTSAFSGDGIIELFKELGAKALNIPLVNPNKTNILTIEPKEQKKHRKCC